MKINNIKQIFYFLNSPNKNLERIKNISLTGSQLIRTFTSEVMSVDPSKIMSVESKVNNKLSLQTVVNELNNFADLSLAEKWDNVGLLIEPVSERTIEKIMLTNDLTENVMEEAIEKEISLIISYHPPIFSPLKKITKATWKERIVASCLEHRIAVFSPHTSWDAVYGGVNDWLADAFAPHLKPNGKHPLIPTAQNDDILYIATIIGTPDCIDRISKDEICMKLSDRSKWDGKEICTTICNKEILKKLKSKYQDISVGILECGKNEKKLSGMGRTLQVTDLTIGDCVRLIKHHTGVTNVRLACAKNETEDSPVQTIALVPGSGGSLLKGVNADLFVTGEMFHHDILEANHNGTSVILTNHSESERGFLSKMALLLNDIFQNEIKIEISSLDSDPLRTV